MLLFICTRHSWTRTNSRFNTSHVTLYLDTKLIESVVDSFQYITCYSLSTAGTAHLIIINSVSIHHMLLFIREDFRKMYYVFRFQYITCYSLSWDSNVVRVRVRGFQYITCYSLSSKRSWQHRFHGVSIHHMLLFIMDGDDVEKVKVVFQYITCYSLSEQCLLSQTARACFNTSHVTLYRHATTITDVWISVSIHHMLLFIL